MTDDGGHDPGELARQIDGCIASQDALVSHLGGLGSTDPTRPSRLPGWTLGHLLSHIARNADSALRLLNGLAQYWKGRESRNADIELGADRTWDELVTDVAETSAAVAVRLREVTEWTGTITAATGVRPKSIVPMLRWGEVEVHRVDLGLGYEFADMPHDYLRHHSRLLEIMWQSRQPMGMTTLPDTVLRLPEHVRLAWLSGRLDVPGVPPAGVY